MNYMTIAGLILVCLAAALGLIEWWSKRRGETFIARLSFSGVVVFLLSGTFWYFGNIYYGNNAAWNLILVWLEGTKWGSEPTALANQLCDRDRRQPAPFYRPVVALALPTERAQRNSQLFPKCD